MKVHSAREPVPAAGHGVHVHAAAGDELEAINAVVASAVLAWPMAERLKRIALRVLRYDPLDFQDMEILVARKPAGKNGRLVGVAAWDIRTPYRSRAGQLGALLHGLYVLPQMQRAGIGSALQHHVARAAAGKGFDGLLVKSERVSVSYFEHCGYQRMPADGIPGVSYPHLFWKALSQ